MPVSRLKSFFAHPNGNYTLGVLDVLRDFKFRAAHTTRRGLVRRRSMLLELPRIAIHEDVSGSPALLMWRLLVQ